MKPIAEMSAQELVESAPRVTAEAEALALLEHGAELFERGRGDEAYEELLARIGLVTRAVVDWAFRQKHLDAEQLFQNPGLTPELAEYLSRRGLADMMAEAHGLETLGKRGEEVVREACRRGLIPFGSVAEQALRTLALSGNGESPPEPEREFWPAIHYRLMAAASVALCPGVRPEVLDELLDTCDPWVRQNRGSGSMLKAFVQSPGATLPIWRRVAGWGGNYPYLLAELAEVREARLDAQIRSRLLQMVSLSHIRRALCLDDREDSLACFRERVRDEPEMAVQVLSHPQCTVTCRLERRDWAAMLASPHAPLRLLAMRLHAEPEEGRSEVPATRRSQGTSR